MELAKPKPSNKRTPKPYCYIKKNKIEVIEFPFPKILEESKFGHDYVFIETVLSVILMVMY